MGDEDESWGDWSQESDWSSTKNTSKTNNKTHESDWSAENEDDFDAWMNDDTSALSASGKSKNKEKSDNDWDTWMANDSSKSSSFVKSSFSLNKSKKKPQKTSAGISSSDSWNDADWNTGFVPTTSKQKEPLVGNLLDLEDGNDLGKSATGCGWDNEVWAAENDDNDDWQTLDLIGNSNKAR